jgi:hypothetical protein
VSLLSLRDPDDIRAAIEIGVREAFAHCSPDVLDSFAAAVGGEIPPLDQPLKLSPAAERGAFDLLKRQERDPHQRVRRSAAAQMIGVGISRLFELEDAGLIDSVMSGGAADRRRQPLSADGPRRRAFAPAWDETQEMACAMGLVQDARPHRRPQASPGPHPS